MFSPLAFTKTFALLASIIVALVIIVVIGTVNAWDTIIEHAWTAGVLMTAINLTAMAAGYGIVRGYVGHGIGNEMHEEPQVTNYRTGRKGRKLEVGLCIAIEPMFTIGSFETRVKPDGWTVATADGSLAAHWEHTVAITADGPRILTLAAGETIDFEFDVTKLLKPGKNTIAIHCHQTVGGQYIDAGLCYETTPE